MPKRRRKRTNPVTNRNWLLFRIAGTITVFDSKHFEDESEDVRHAAVDCRAEIIRLQRLLKGETD